MDASTGSQPRFLGWQASLPSSKATRAQMLEVALVATASAACHIVTRWLLDENLQPAHQLETELNSALVQMQKLEKANEQLSRKLQLARATPKEPAKRQPYGHVTSTMQASSC